MPRRPPAPPPCLEACTCCVRPPDALTQSLDELDFARSAAAAASTGHTERLAALLRADPARAAAAGPGGYTPLHYAARGGHASAVQLLLSAGAAVDARTAEGGATPLHRAATAGAVEVVALL
jgi:ankyrin repeat protein